MRVRLGPILSGREITSPVPNRDCESCRRVSDRTKKSQTLTSSPARAIVASIVNRCGSASALNSVAGGLKKTFRIYSAVWRPLGGYAEPG